MKAIGRIILGVCMMLLYANVHAEAVAIVVNANNTQELTLQDIKNIYADRVVKWDNGNKIEVLNLPVDSAEREVFSQAVLGVSTRVAVAKEHNRKITNRIQNPSNVKTARMIKMLVSRSENVIGYVPARLLNLKNNKRIRVVKTLP